MDYIKILSDYAYAHNWKLEGNRWTIIPDVTAYVTNNTIRICDERTIKYALQFEENPYEDKSGGLFYSAETGELYKDLDSVIEYIIVGDFLKTKE